MSVVAVIATKGGAGKSTVAAHLSIAAAMKKRRPLIIDFDKRQLSILLWSKGLRKSVRKPAVQKGSLETLADDLAAARKRYDLIVIDVAAGGGDEVRDIATLAEHILVPVRASTFDISATRTTIELLRNCADNTEPEEIAYRNALGKAAIVLNCAPKRQSQRWRSEVDEALESCGAGSVPVIGALSDREAYAEALEHGQGVTEDKDDPEAVREVLELYQGLVEMEAERHKKLRKARRAS
jgi:chromosome partitioning protein